MEEKRKHKRLDLDVEIQLERLDEEGVTTLKYVHVDITDISRSGVGYRYGAIFIGMTDTDALKIDIYQIFNDL